MAQIRGVTASILNCCDGLQPFLGKLTWIKKGLSTKELELSLQIVEIYSVSGMR